MKIRFSLIPPESVEKVRSETDILQQMVDSGNMDGVDESTSRLLALTSNCQSIDVTEEDWRQFLKDSRERNPAFKSNYLIPGLTCTGMFPTASTNDYVLELPFDEEGRKDGVCV